MAMVSRAACSCMPAACASALERPCALSELFRLKQWQARRHSLNLWPGRRRKHLQEEQWPRSPGFRVHAALLGREDRSALLAGVDKEYIPTVTRALELAATAVSRWEVAHTDFLAPPAVAAAEAAVTKLADAGAVVSGGYPQAERCRLTVGRADQVQIEAGSEAEGRGYPGAIAALNVSGNFMFDPAAHGDFLGAILGTGIVRDKVGDIIVLGERGAQVLVVPELVDFFTSSLKQVRTVPVTVEQIGLDDLQIRTPRVDTFRSVEASLRLDALASAGFRMSRSKLADLISSKMVRVNWKEVSKSGATLKTGDVVSLRGKGRLEIGNIEQTKKGRYAVELTRYL